jgi:hypothetical protein
MPEPKENKSFFRKVVQFVSNPTQEWAELHSRQDEGKDIERSELRAMVERKRRNDFVRKREFDMLRRVRREGLTADQLATLGPLSRLEDESRHNAGDSQTARTQGVVKAKIDHIEREMVGESPHMRGGSKSASFFDAPTEPGVLSRRGPATATTPLGQLPRMIEVLGDSTALPALPSLPDVDLTDVPVLHEPALTPALMSSGVGPLAPASLGAAPGIAGGTPEFPMGAQGLGIEVETTDIVHDPELDEAVIAFANADFAQCERSLQQLIGPNGLRAQHAETWLVVFDLYRATGQQQNFESLAMDYAHRFGWSAPQWFSMPRQVAEAKAGQENTGKTAASASAGDVGWVAPPTLDTDAVARLRSQTLQLPLPWVLDWTGVKQVEAEAATQLSTLFRLWSGQAIEMRWIGGERLFGALAEAAPTGVRDADPAFWLARLDALRLANRADQFDEAAIDYCVTYEVSPPSWEPARCTVRVSEPGQPTLSPQLSVMSEVSTSFHDSGLLSDPGGMVQVAQVDLSGQLVGDLSATLERINASLGGAPLVTVTCTHLIRVDFIAAGDLLNWVLARRHEGRQLQFLDTHRLVALFFGAMGINEHAKVEVRRI